MIAWSWELAEFVTRVVWLHWILGTALVGGVALVLRLAGRLNASTRHAVWMIVLFVTVPLAELALLIWVGARIGTLTTIGIVIFTGVLGATLAERRKHAHRLLEQGQIPFAHLLQAGEALPGEVVRVHTHDLKGIPVKKLSIIRYSHHD